MIPIGPQLAEKQVDLKETIVCRNRRKELIDVYRKGLLDDTLRFWIPRMIDREYGGYLCSRDHDGALLDTDKGMWQQGRVAWMLGSLYNTVERKSEWLDLCKHGLDFITAHGFDPHDGRMWFHVTQEGKPVRKRRYAFTESFAAIAYGEYAKASGRSEYAEKASQIFQNFIDHNTIPGRAAPKFTDTRPTQGLAFPMITIATCQELRGSIDLPQANDWIDRCIQTIQDCHVKFDIKCVMETVGPKGEIYNHFDGRTLNPGHAIECAWFIMHEGKHRDDAGLISLGLKMLDYMWERGWDKQFGGIFYYVDVYGKPVQEYWRDMKFWWPQNETIIATLLAYALTGNEKYACWHDMIHRWAYAYFPDRDHGEWYGYLHRDGRMSVPLKGNLWKSMFHLPRMQQYCWKLLEEMQVKENNSSE